MIAWMLGGVLVGAGLFASFLFSAFQGVMQRGPLQWAHIAAALLTVGGIASLSLLSPLLALVSGGLLLLAGAGILVLEKGWNRLLALFQMAFAIMLILGLPFAV